MERITSVLQVATEAAQTLQSQMDVIAKENPAGGEATNGGFFVGRTRMPGRTATEMMAEERPETRQLNLCAALTRDSETIEASFSAPEPREDLLGHHKRDCACTNDAVFTLPAGRQAEGGLKVCPGV